MFILTWFGVLIPPLAGVVLFAYVVAAHRLCRCFRN